MSDQIITNKGKILELAAELAHDATYNELKDIYPNDDDLWNETQYTRNYKEDVQDVFYRWYDYFLERISNILEIEL